MNSLPLLDRTWACFLVRADCVESCLISSVCGILGMIIAHALPHARERTKPTHHGTRQTLPGSDVCEPTPVGLGLPY